MESHFVHVCALGMNFADRLGCQNVCAPVEGALFGAVFRTCVYICRSFDLLLLFPLPARSFF